MNNTFLRPWLTGELNQSRRLISEAVTATVIGNVLQIVSSLFVMAVYNKIIPNEAIPSLLTLAFGVVLVIGFEFGFKTIRVRLVNDAAKKVEASLQPKLFAKVLSWDLHRVPKFAGSTATLTRDLDSVIELFASSSISTVVGIPFVIVYLGVIWAVAGALSLVTLGIVVVTASLAIWHYYRVVALAEEQKKVSIERNSLFIEATAHLETLKSIGSYDYFQNKWDINLTNAQPIELKLKTMLADITNVNQSISSVGQVILVGLGAFLVIQGEISSGGLIAAVILNGRTLQPVMQLAGLIQKLSTARSSITRLNAIFEVQSDEENRRQNIRLPKVAPPITLSNLSFTPEGLNSPVIKIPMLKLQANEHVGIVGSVGSGKSTLAKLLAGVLTPTEGSVQFDVFDTSAIHQADLRKNVAFLGQSPAVFGGTVRDNIVLNVPDLKDEDLLSVIKVTGLEAVLKKLPNGLSFQLSEGGRELSGGQKQILALARALASSPSVLILDEPTSAMDPKHEHLFIQKMKQFVQDRTMIVVTHRKPILSLVDRILVVESGRIVMDGKRDEILKKFQ